MNHMLLYATTVLIWGSTWYAIKMQLGVVEPMLSVAYRFGLAAALLFGFCFLTHRRMRFSLSEHGFMLLLGISLFSLNYWLFYQATTVIASGLVAVTFSTVTVMNIFNGALFLGIPVRRQVVAGAVLGLIGIALVFLPELQAFHLQDAGFVGLLFCMIATYSASIGNIVAARNNRHGLPIVQGNAYGMLYGAVLMFVFAWFDGAPLRFDWSLSYVSSLLYLSVFGSVVAFGCYLTLIGRIGADKAAYASLLFPLVALSISTWLEGYHWSGLALLGMSLILIGNVLVLAPTQLWTQWTPGRRIHLATPPEL